MPHHTTRRVFGLAALLLTLIVPAANAQFFFFPNDTTLDASNTIPPPGTAIVGFASFDDLINGVNATSPIITVAAGADVNELEVLNSSTINMSGGSIGSSSFLGRLLASDSSLINISGGSLPFDLDMQFNSTASFRGGVIGDDIVTHDDTTVNMSGGTVEQDLLLNNNSIFNLSGGTVLDEIFVQDSSILNIFGAGLSSVLVDPDFQGFYSEYSLFGHLSDNTDLAGRLIFVQNGSGAGFTLNSGIAAVPEPGTSAFVLTALVSGGILAVSRRREVQHKQPIISTR